MVITYSTEVQNKIVIVMNVKYNDLIISEFLS